MTAILILDTCAVLDLIRAPVRTEFHVSFPAGARATLEAARQPQAIVRLLVSDVVRREFDRNLPTVWDDALRQIKKRGADYRHVLDVVAAYSDVPRSHCVDEQWLEDNLHHGRNLAESIMATADTEVASVDDQLRGGQRVGSRIAPAGAGNNNWADCVITETALRVAGAHNTGLPNAPKVVFLTSNTADFCTLTRLKDSLQTEFDGVNLIFTTNWGHAWASIRTAL